MGEGRLVQRSRMAGGWHGVEGGMPEVSVQIDWRRGEEGVKGPQ